MRAERWPALLPAARELGVHGVCCFPLGIGAVRLGALTVLCDGERRLSDQQYTDATALTAVLRLRAHAYSSERPLREIAADVVARRLRFDGDFDDEVSGPYSPDGGKG